MRFIAQRLRETVFGKQWITRTTRQLPFLRLRDLFCCQSEAVSAFGQSRRTLVFLPLEFVEES
jgi:hypothetical protein